MPQNNKLHGTPQEWLARAKSNLSLAHVKRPEDVFLEDMCFNAQQAVEKALKAVLQYKGIVYRYVHDIEELITTLTEHGISVPENIREAVCLTQYAVETRYPGDFEPVTEDEFKEVLTIAEKVVDWVESQITLSES